MIADKIKNARTILYYITKLPMKGTELDYADSLKRVYQSVHIFISSDIEEDVEIIKNTFERWRDSQ